MKIGTIIKEERLKREMTQEKFAQEFYVTRQLISKWENGKSYPDLDQVVQMSDWFDLPLDYLLKEDTKMIDELTFDTKLKKRFKVGGLIIGLFLWGCIFALALGYWFLDAPLLQKKDIEITQIKKIILPEEQIIHPQTGETWTLPEDIYNLF